MTSLNSILTKPTLKTGPDRALLVDKSPRSYVTEEDTVFNLKEETFTVEDAVEHMGFGKFQLKLFFICGLFSVSLQNRQVHLNPQLTESSNVSEYVILLTPLSFS